MKKKKRLSFVPEDVHFSFPNSRKSPNDHFQVIWQKICTSSAIHLFLLISFFGTFSLFASENISGDFSGQPLDKVFAEIAKVGKLNMVGDFADQKVPCARFKEEVYYEEAFSLVAKSCGLTIRRVNSIWLVLPLGQERRLDSDRTVTRFPHWRSSPSLAEALRPLLYPEMHIWFPPFTSAIAMFSTPEYIGELKKVMETLDTPVHSVQIDIILKKGADQTMVASASFVTLSWKPFRLTHTTAASQSESFDLQGLLGMNDDGILHGKCRLEIQSNGKRVLYSQEFSGKDRQWIDHIIDLSGTPMTISLRGTAVRMNGRILPPQEVVYLRPSSKSSSKTETIPRNRTITEIPHGETITLDKPLIFVNAPIVQVIEQLAAKEKIPIVCDAAVSGTISVYCFGDEVNLVDLISGIGKTKGYDVFPHANGLIIGETTAVRGLVIGETPPYLTGSIQALSPASACHAIQEGFKEGNIVGTVEMQPEDRLKITAEKNGLLLAETLNDLWINPLNQFSLGVQVFRTKETLEETQSVSLEKVFFKEWKSSGGAVSVSLSPAFIDQTDGLRQVQISLESKDSQFEHWNLHCTTNLPDDPSIPIFNGQGNSPLKVLWKAVIATDTPETVTEQNSSDTAPFDGAFDSTF